MYIVKINGGRYSDTFTLNMFVTDDLDKAESWVKRFNKIIDDNYVRIDTFYDNNDFGKNEPYL